MSIIHKCNICGLEQPYDRTETARWNGSVASAFYEVEGKPDHVCEQCAQALIAIAADEKKRMKRRLALRLKALRWECSVERV